ncbi:hypothetical protein MRB53_035889 [Persea americana]|uniref:Uncharacterized protein n=1 Tax=Persea americana TaxID=3435 RepID=A0ACC2K6D0_PERAE|nr:hypothetical protein MRB53_035889 [Persea americana]
MVFFKRTPLLRSTSSRGDRSSFFHKPRSRFARFLLFEKVDYFQWICTIAVFFFVVILFQAFLPGSVVDKSSDSLRGLDFGERIRFVPSKLLEKFRREAIEANRSAASSRPGIRAALRKPQLALVLADLSVDAVQLQMISIATSLQEIGYSIQVYSLEDGPVHAVWRKIGFSVTVLQISNKSAVAMDWLKEAPLVTSLNILD